MRKIVRAAVAVALLWGCSNVPAPADEPVETQPQIEACSTVYDATLRANGVDNSRLRASAVKQLLAAKAEGKTVHQVAAAARVAADRISDDIEWVDWVSWNAGNAYQEECSL